MKKITISVLFFILCGVMALQAGWLLEPEGDEAAPASKPVATPVATPAKTETPPPPATVVSNTPVIPAPAAVKYEVVLINLKKVDAGSVNVSWQNPANIKGYVLKVYRDTAALDSAAKIVDSKMIVKLDPPAVTYIDKPAVAGKYFYAVTVTYEGTEYKTLTPDISYTSFGVNLAPVVVAAKPAPTPVPTPTPPPVAAPVVVPSVPSPVSGLAGVVQKENEIMLSWVPSAETNIKYNVYRDSNPIQLSNELPGILKTVSGNFTDTVDGPGTYFYAVTTVNGAGENKQIIFGANSLANAVVITPKPVEVVKVPEPVKTEPVVVVRTQIRVVIPTVTVAKPEPVEVEEPTVPAKLYDDILLDVKRSSYYEERYQTALVALKGIVGDADCPDEVRNEAELFIGKCYYQLGRYSEAIKSLVRVRKFFPEEVDFWISRAANKL